MNSSSARLALVITAGAVWCSGVAVAGRNLVESPTPPAKPSRSGDQAPATQPAASPPIAKGNVENGQALYLKYGCYTCHGYAGQGGSAGRPLAPDPIALPSFTRITRRPPNVMPPYTEKVVTDQELADIHAYLGTLPRPPAAATIPLLQDKKQD